MAVKVGHNHRLLFVVANKLVDHLSASECGNGMITAGVILLYFRRLSRRSIVNTFFVTDCEAQSILCMDKIIMCSLMSQILRCQQRYMYRCISK